MKPKMPTPGAIHVDPGTPSKNRLLESLVGEEPLPDPPMRRNFRRKLAKARKRLATAHGDAKIHWRGIIERILKSHREN